MKARTSFIAASLAAAVLSCAVEQGWAQVPDYTKPNYANSPPLRKFVDSLPGLGAANTNNLGQYIPVATPDTNSFPGSDYYEIGLRDYAARMHSDLPVTGTKLRGYYQINGPDKSSQYLGPLIVAKRDRPVRVKFVNQLATGPAGNLFLPVDTTVMGAGAGPVMGENYTQNRATLHLHGIFGPWISDGTPHQWITPAGEVTSYPKGVSVVDVPDMPVQGSGSMTFYWPNQQSSRLMFYHDHAYGLTRLNVYAGEAAGYLLTDPAEQGLVNAGVVPADQIPLIIQDKTFVPGPAQLAATDPLWNTAQWGGLGNLWFPHVYQPNQDPKAVDGINPVGRWDYGALVWPPVNTNGPLPAISHVPEAFMDTPVVNGTAYPYLKVQPKAYRFRVLNACNDRMLNLQLYYAQGNAADPDGLHRTSGEPDMTRPGPAFYQIGNEGGLLPVPAVLNNPPQPIGYDTDTRSATLGNVNRYTLLLGPAERADIVVDFSAVPPGSKLILYNDAPAPLPLEDLRYDYYTGNPDLTAFGGAPSTLAGYGPNTRTLMQFQVEGTPAAALNTAALNTALAAAFASSQPALIVPAGVVADNALISAIAGQQYLNGIPIKVKTVTEGFDNLGRMSAVLGDTTVTMNNQGHATFGLTFDKPITETLPEGATEVWALVHRGVDTHVIHWHLLNVQVINRVDAAGVITPPDANELGWKESIRVNPFESLVVAVRAAKPALPFSVPNSVRPRDVTMPVDPVVNPLTDYGWEYVWHCHLLGHEENDMMRPLVLQVNNGVPTAPALLAAAVSGPPLALNLTWQDNGVSETGFRLERATVAGGVPGAYTLVAALGANVTSQRDATVVAGTTYSYRVCATGTAGNSAWASATVATPAVPTAPSAFGSSPSAITLKWADNSTDESGFELQRAAGTGAFGTLATVGPNVTAYTDASVAVGVSYSYRVRAFNVAGASAWIAATIGSATTETVPTAPTDTRLSGRLQTSLTVNWVDASSNERGFNIYRSTVATGPWQLVGTAGANTGSFPNSGLTANTTYFYQVTAFNSAGESAPSPIVSGKTAR